MGSRQVGVQDSGTIRSIGFRRQKPESNSSGLSTMTATGDQSGNGVKAVLFDFMGFVDEQYSCPTGGRPLTSTQNMS